VRSRLVRTAAIGIALLGGAEAPVGASGQAPPAGASGQRVITRRPAAPRRRRRPIAESIEKAVDEVMSRHYDPCAIAKQRGVPCFPSGIDAEGPRYSVADSFRKYRTDGRRAEGAPITASDMHGQMGGAPLSASGGVSLDPVCTVKSLIRRISGTGELYLYRLSDGQQVRPVLTDRKIDAAVYASNPRASYEYMGEYSGECEAIAAWRKALREAVAPASGGEGGDEPADPGPGAPPPESDEVTVRDRTATPGSGPPPP
jgi:hypothetical protein